MPAETLRPLPSLELVDQLEVATRDDLSSAIDNLGRLRDLDAHLLRGFDTWHTYVVHRFGDLLARLNLPRQEKVALAASMSAPTAERPTGMPVRAIAETLGVSVGTAQNYRREAGRVIAFRPRADAKLPAPAGYVYEQAAEWIRRADDGLTLVELAGRAGWTEGKASGALTYLYDRNLVARTEDRRAGQRPHFLTEAGAVLAASGS
ncbi:hypothetical protein [Blastococcus sp. CT_GayMR16]|uniref:hypothetical protein n=1 Tax=Blastococcus sp. CT_GayMR16 TaxID=2559607 RepID=UPI001074530D|nr:hypothetical protein [Blastococcus sp. CT_GayMR16]TFV83177.1 hypothetical protein E4P38_21205 [Blastococcus sp. CT_GayMR16]